MPDNREVGLTPAVYVEALRVEAARQRLERGADPVDVVAARVGFGTPETMRRAFARRDKDFLADDLLGSATASCSRRPRTRWPQRAGLASAYSVSRSRHVLPPSREHITCASCVAASNSSPTAFSAARIPGAERLEDVEVDVAAEGLVETGNALRGPIARALPEDTRVGGDEQRAVRRMAAAGRPAARPRDRRRRVHRQLRGRDSGDRRDRHLGDRLRGRPLVDRRDRLRRRRPRPARARSHACARPVLPRHALAAHARIGAARVGEGRRRAHRGSSRACGAASLPSTARPASISSAARSLGLFSA